MSNTYFYHPDHLGSTSLVTNSYGEITQNISYIPYGEIFVEETSGGWQSPYYFNAKELDEETGLYYYGARYLDPAGARWLSADPMLEKYVGMSPYNYCAGNPVKLVDPDGRVIKIRVYNKQLGRNEFLTYKDNNFWHEDGKRYNPQKESLGSNVYNLLSSYRKIESSNDKLLKNKLQTLQKSENTHWIDFSEEETSGVVPYTGNATEALEKVAKGESVGSWTILNFSEQARFKEIEGIEASCFSTVTHELSHQYDNEVGNNKEYGQYDKNPWKNPAEIRAVENENRGRRIEGLKERKTYGGKEIDFNQNH